MENGQPAIAVTRYITGRYSEKYFPLDLTCKVCPKFWQRGVYAYQNGQFQEVSKFTTRRTYSVYGDRDDDGPGNEKPIPPEASALYKQGADLLAAGKPADALVPYGKAIALLSDYTDALTDLSYAYALLGQWRESQQTAAQAVKYNPWYDAAQYNLGVAHLHLGEYKEAEAHLYLATSMEEARWEPHYALGQVYEKQEKLQEAAHEYARALQLAPDQSDVKQALVRVQGH